MATTIRITTTKGRLQEIAKDLQDTLADLADDASDHAPIARITIGKSGGIFIPQHLYAPGLPSGEHDLWCVPVRAAAQPADDGLAVRALEELHQLGYAVRDGLLYPPEHAQPAGNAARPRPELPPTQCDAGTCETGCACPGDCIASGRAAGDAAMPVVAGNDHEANVLRELQAIANDGDGEFWPTMVAIGALGIIGRQQANYAALERCATGLQADLVEERNRIASMRTEWGAEVAALTAQARHAEAEAAKSERRAIEFGDALHRHILAMRAAFVAWHRGEASDGMGWIANTLAGPGHLPAEADIALGAQALFDKEVAEHEAFRAANPGPVAPASKPTTPAASALPPAAEPEASFDIASVTYGPQPGGLDWSEAGLFEAVGLGATGPGIDAANLATDPSCVWGPEHLAPQPAHGLEFDHRGVLVPVAPAPRDTAAMLAQLMDRVAEYGSACVQEDRNDMRRGHESQAGHPEYDLQAMLSEIEAIAKRMLGTL